MAMTVLPPPSRSWISNPLMRNAAAALVVLLGLATLAYLATSAWALATLDAGAELKQPLWVEVLGAPYRVLSKGNNDVWEAVMILAALYLGIVGLLLGFGAERDADKMARWRAVATLALSSSGLVSAAEAAVLLMPEAPPTGKHRWARDRFGMVGKSTTYDLGGGRSAKLHFDSKMTLTVSNLPPAPTQSMSFDYDSSIRG